MVFAAASLAANLKDVRVGPHGEYTRVVLETDAKASYSLSQSSELVTIELQASASAKAVAAKSQQLSWVRVEPLGESSVVRIELKGPARVKQMVLTGPNRIVLDIYADAAASTRRAPAPKPMPAVAEPAPAPSLDPADAPRSLDAEAALVQKEADALLGPDEGALPGDDLAAAEGVPADGELAAIAEPEIAPPAELPQPAAVHPVEVAKRKRSLLDWLQDPYILAGLAIVMGALVLILRRRRPLAQAPAPPATQDEGSAASLFGPSSEASAALVTEDAEAAGVSDGVDVEEPTADVDAGESASAPAEESGSPFDFEAPEVDPEKPELGPARGAMLSTIGAVTSTAAYETQAPTATGGLNLAELERRLSLLEQRLEEVIDAKDRLERQVSAQTEELRVQRAAIARTQRVLRTVVRPEDDQPSEPVLKG